MHSLRSEKYFSGSRKLFLWGRCIVFFLLKPIFSDAPPKTLYVHLYVYNLYLYDIPTYLHIVT